MPPDPPDGAATLATARHALAHWNLEVADLELISQAENVVFRVDTASGARYVLRIHRPGYSSLAELKSERQWTAALREAGIDVPTGVATAGGEPFATVVLPDRSQRHAGLLEWVEGELLERTIQENVDEKRVATLFEQLGRIAARIHNQSSGWHPPAGFVRRAWDADGLMGENPLWGRFWEVPQFTPAEREILLDARDRIHGALLAFGNEAGDFSLIHADLHPYNVVLHGDRLHVIDFDDAGFGWHLYELAVPLFRVQGRPVYEAAAAALIAGYRQERPLSEAGLRLLPMFMLVRAMAALGWAHTRSELELQAHIARLRERVLVQADSFLAGRLRM